MERLSYYNDISAHFIWGDLTETHIDKLIEIPEKKGILIITLRYRDGTGHWIGSRDNYYLNIVNEIVEFATWDDSETETTIYELKGFGKETTRKESVENLSVDRKFIGVLVEDELWEKLRMKWQ